MTGKWMFPRRVMDAESSSVWVPSSGARGSEGGSSTSLPSEAGSMTLDPSEQVGPEQATVGGPIGVVPGGVEAGPEKGTNPVGAGPAVGTDGFPGAEMGIM